MKKIHRIEREMKWKETVNGKTIIRWHTRFWCGLFRRTFIEEELYEERIEPGMPEPSQLCERCERRFAREGKMMLAKTDADDGSEG